MWNLSVRLFRHWIHTQRNVHDIFRYVEIRAMSSAIAWVLSIWGIPKAI